MAELGSALAAVAQSLHCRQKAIAAVCAGGSPGQAFGFALQQAGQGIQSWNGASVLADGLLLKLVR